MTHPTKSAEASLALGELVPARSHFAACDLKVHVDENDDHELPGGEQPSSTHKTLSHSPAIKTLFGDINLEITLKTHTY